VFAALRCAVADPTPTGHKDRTSRAVSTLERQAQALEWRKLGYAYPQIAEKVGFHDASGARKAVMAALRKLIQEPGEEVLRLELERLDTIIRSLMPFVLKGSPRHAEVVLKTMDRRALYLGLDKKAPTEDHQRITIEIVAAQMALREGLNKDELVAEAERILAEARDVTA